MLAGHQGAELFAAAVSGNVRPWAGADGPLSASAPPRGSDRNEVVSGLTALQSRIDKADAERGRYNASMDHPATLERLLRSDPLRRSALEAVASFNLADCWIGAGFVRDAAWDYLHGYATALPSGDVDVVWFSCVTPQDELDRRIEDELRRLLPDLQWSVKNQARMHLRNGDRSYASTADAMRHWPETATAVAARYDASGSIEINAPFGLDDLFAMRLRPTPTFLTDKLPVFQNRVTSKRWIERYPLLTAHR